MGGFVGPVHGCRKCKILDISKRVITNSNRKQTTKWSIHQQLEQVGSGEKTGQYPLSIFGIFSQKKSHGVISAHGNSNGMSP